VFLGEPMIAPSQTEPGIVFLGEPMRAEADGWSLGLSLLLRCLEIRELRTWPFIRAGLQTSANFFPL
jgi:hypothetical protein